jgi:hypothetical protein
MTATVANPATAPAVAFSHCHRSDLDSDIDYDCLRSRFDREKLGDGFVHFSELGFQWKQWCFCAFSAACSAVPCDGGVLGVHTINGISVKGRRAVCIFRRFTN